MDSIKDIMIKKADNLDIDEKRDDLHILQAELDRLYPEQIRILHIKDAKAHIATKNAPVAANLRYEKDTIMQHINKMLKNPLEDIRVSIR